MKPLLAFFSIALLGSLSIHAKVSGLREWTDQKSRSMQASLIRIYNEKQDGKEITKASFKLKNGKKVSIPVSTLSSANQQELRAWVKNNPTGVAPPAPPYKWPSQYNGSNAPKVVYVKFDTTRKAHLYRTKHFDFFIDQDISKSTVSKCVAVFDSIVEAIDSLPMQLDTIPSGNRKRYQALLVSSRDTYMKLGGIPNSGGFFSPRQNLTVIPFTSLGIVKKGNKWVFDGKRRSFDTLLHELTHHSTSHWRGMPPWFEEGFADYMESMPYQSGRFLFTNPGSAISSSIREYKKYTVANGIIPGGVFKMIHPQKLFATNRQNWNGMMKDRIASARNYTSSAVLVYYFMHEDGDGDGAHFIQWLHAWRAAVLSRNSSSYNELIKTHLLRDRAYSALEGDIQDAMRKKGLRVSFSN